VTNLSLDGKAAIITGAGQGIGRAIAELLADRGALVSVNDWHKERAEQTAAGITTPGGSAFAFAGDAATRRVAESLVSAALERWGRLDLLVNNAGIGGTGKPLVELSEEEWNEMLRVNLGSVFQMCRAAAPHMMARGWGRIVNLSSIFGLAGASGSTHYAASKAAIIGFSKSLARELAGSRITVNVVAPGLIDTPMFRARGVAAGPPLLLWPRVGQPRDVAEAVAFLCSEEAEFITGQVISPNGGGWM
jgi:NAD(P)-dependent dehydrogenase (short-subunit alcohol dehydrogenase family)